MMHRALAGVRALRADGPHPGPLPEGEGKCVGGGGGKIGLKGRDVIAQGAALGTGSNIDEALQGRDNRRGGACVLVPRYSALSGLRRNRGSSPRAPPWAIVFRSFRAFGYNVQVLDVSVLLPSAQTDHERTALVRPIEHTDAEIDRLVYERYGLSSPSPRPSPGGRREYQEAAVLEVQWRQRT